MRENGRWWWNAGSEPADQRHARKAWQFKWMMLVETKGNHILNGDNIVDKVLAEHRLYGVPLMLVQDDAGRFITVKHFPNIGSDEQDRIFRIENLAGYSTGWIELLRL